MSEFSKEEMEAKLTEYGIPDYMHGSLIKYIMHGAPVGHFLGAIFSNDLREAVSRGDDANQAKIVEYVKFLYNYAPGGCWGSPENFRNWLSHKGLEFKYPGKEDYAYPDGHGPEIDPAKA